jgi:cytochrome P450
MSETVRFATTAVELTPEQSALVVSSDAYAEWNKVHQLFSDLRRRSPVARVNAKGFDPFWLITRHSDIQEIGRQPAIFSNNGHRAGIISQEGERHLKELAAAGLPPNRTIVSMDPPEHGVYRMLTFGAFAPKGIKALEGQIRALARESIDEMGETGGECDFVADVALRFPLRVILSILGIPRADEDLLLSLTQEYFNPQDSELNVSKKDVDIEQTESTSHEVLGKFVEYFDNLTMELRRLPRDGVASVIANAKVDGDYISLWDAASYYITIATAGHDTTSSSIAGAIAALAERPASLRDVQEDPTLIPGLVDEAIRWITPILHFMRTAATDYNLGGYEIRKGDWLMLSYPSGNRDESVFGEDAAEFNVRRFPNPHISFGHGAHLCLGQHLAKLEMRVFFEELLPRLSELKLTGPAVRTKSVLVGGLKRVPIKFSLAPP